MLARSGISISLVCLLGGCAFAGKTMPAAGPGMAAGSLARPGVVQKGKGAQWVTFTPHTISPVYSAMALGPDSNVWFLDENGGSLARIAESGATKEFSLQSVLTGNAVSMTVGADKKFYVLDEGSSVIRVTDKGDAVSFPIPSGDNTAIDGLALGPDGNVWFDEFDHIGKITPAGKISEFPYPSGIAPNQYGGVTAGSDGNVWFAASSANAIGRIDPASGKFKMFPIPATCIPAPVVLANDGNVWFVCLSSSPLFGRITPKGKIATFSGGGTFNFNETEQFCARGPDGDPWCASRNDSNVFRIDSKTHKVTTYAPPLASNVTPDAVVAGADGNVWVDTVGGQIAVLVTNPITVKPPKLTFSGPAQKQTLSVTESGTGSWLAKSSNAAVATVAQGKKASLFTVTSVESGHCKITIADAVGNSVAVSVEVK